MSATPEKPTEWTISELSKDFDITTRTIRFYEAEGLLSPRREGQKRIYSSKDRVTLKLIMRGKRLGFSLAESRELIEMYQPESNQAQTERVLEKVQESRQRLLQQQDDIKIMLLELDAHEERVKQTQQNNKT